MKKSIALIAVLFVFHQSMAQVQRMETAHFKAKYDSEVEAYATASLKVLEAAWTIASNNGFYLPEKIKFTMVVSERNALYFNRKSLKEITWEYESLDDFLPPDKSRKNNIYGLCHEIGHLCMHNTNHNRNNWMSYDYRESWADYFGNMLIDSIHTELGIDFWPEPHDYKQYAGMEFFIHRIEKDNPKLLSFNKAGLFWYELGNEIGFSRIFSFFESIESQKVDNPGAKEKGSVEYFV
jgi:hypothetical protein